MVLALGLAAFFGFGLQDALTFDALHKNRMVLFSWITAHQVMAALAFVGVYALATALSLPIGSLLTLGAGFLYGSAIAAALPGAWRESLVSAFGPSAPGIVGTAVTTVYVVIGATIGATVLFVAARTAFADILRAKAGPTVKRMEAGFRENGLSYMLILRLIPAFPFWLVNLAPAFLGVSLPVFVLGTFFGIIPGTFVYALVGNGLGSVFAECDMRPTEPCLPPDLGTFLLQPSVILPIVGLILLAALPVLRKRLKTRRAA